MTTLGYTREYVQEDYPDAMSFVPHSVRTEHTARAITAQRIVTSVRPLGGSSVSAGGNLIFQLPYGEGAGFMKAGSAYIRADLVVSGASSTGTFGFPGSMGAADTLINQLNINIGGAQVENVLYLNKLSSNVINPWMTSASYINNLSLTSGLCGGQTNLKSLTWDAAQTSTAQLNNLPYKNFTNTVATSSTTAVVGNDNPKLLIPLHTSGLLNGGDSLQAVPICLLNAPMQIQCLMSSVNDGIWSSPTFTPTNWTLNNIELIYEKINPEPSYIQELKHQMASKLYVIPLTTVQSVTFQGGSNTSYNASLNSSAVKGAAFGYLPVAAQASSASNSKAFCAPTGANAALDTNGGVFNRILLLDSEPQDLFPDRCLDAPTKIAENFRCVSGQVFSDPDLNCNISSVGSSSYGDNSFGTYYGSNTVSMFNLQPYTPEVGVVMNGRPTNIANFIAQWLQPQATVKYDSSDSWYGFFFVQELLCIAGDGSATIVK